MRALFDEIRSHLAGDASSAAIGATLEKVQAEAVRQRQARARHEAKTIDLLADHADVVAADRALGEALLNERRLDEAEKQLRARQAARAEIEVEAARAADWRKATAIREEALREISRAWCAHANGFAALVKYIGEVDAEIAAACPEPPKNCEAVPRVLNGIYSYGAVRNVTKPVADHLSIPGIPEWDAPDVHGAAVTRG